MLHKAFHFFLFTSLFVILIAVGMVWQTASQLNIKHLNNWYYFFVLGGSAASYNIHWYLTKNNDPVTNNSSRIQWTIRYKHILLFFAITGLLIAGVACWFLRNNWLYLGISIIIASLYTAPKIPGKISEGLKKIAISKTIYLSLAWTYITTFLPLIISGSEFSHPANITFITYRFFLLYSNCILFDYKDREEDIKNGIRSLITCFSEKSNIRLFYFAVIAALVNAFLFAYYNNSLINGFFLSIPLILLIWLLPKFKAGHNDYLYYFVLDGLMAFSLVFTSWL
ncbi:MAG TPA: UbiA family prenyltransferase [Chitinophagaceae bacterium]|nr:UbiA family prenyltransferase [Chitinophagaceae bacterium]